MIDYLEIPVSQINNIKNGAGWTSPNGRTFSHEELTTPAEPTRAYAYCSDTRYVPTLHELIAGVDLLYHESTYCRDSQHRAEAYWHSTAADAATVAREAGVKKLLLGHYSSRYPARMPSWMKPARYSRNPTLPTKMTSSTSEFPYEGQKIG